MEYKTCVTILSLLRKRAVRNNTSRQKRVLFTYLFFQQFVVQQKFKRVRNYFRQKASFLFITTSRLDLPKMFTNERIGLGRQLSSRLGRIRLGIYLKNVLSFIWAGNLTCVTLDARRYMPHGITFFSLSFVAFIYNHILRMGYFYVTQHTRLNSVNNQGNTIFTFLTDYQLISHLWATPCVHDFNLVAI